MEKLKTAIIGFGGMAQYHYKKMTESGLFEIKGVYDIDPQACKRAEKRNLTVYESAEALAGDKDIEIVLIATPNDVHEAYGVQMAKAGKNVICEKPVTLSSESLKKMIDTARENRVLLMVHQNRRWDKDFLIIKNIHDSNLMGNMYKVESNVTGSHGVPGSWRKIKARGGGMLWDWGVHLIDQMLFMHSEKVTGVTCRGSYVYGLDCDDGIDMILDFADGFQAKIYIDTNKFIPTPRWYAYGLDGTGIIKGWNCRGKIIKVKTFEDKKNKGINAGNGFTKTMANRSHSTVWRHRLPKVNIEKYAFYKNVYDCVRNGAEPVITNESVMRCMLVMEAGFKSMAEKRTVETDI